MAREILFPEVEPLYVFDRDCLAFRALADGKPVECMATAEFLLARFGAHDVAEGSLRQAYRDHKHDIQEIARNHIANGWIDEEGRIFLTTRFTRLDVTFGGRLNAWDGGRESATAAHRILTEIIGPNAEEVVVEWAGEGHPPGQLSITLRISDPSIPHSVKLFLGPNEWENETTLRVILAGAWGATLRARSRKLLLTSG